ncbi:MAG: hypothetical protein PHS97_03945 [Oscillospiraceae bacterium]|nr:hypothetical protein [Oscillospiraceae bacterium]
MKKYVPVWLPVVAAVLVAALVAGAVLPAKAPGGGALYLSGNALHYASLDGKTQLTPTETVSATGAVAGSSALYLRYLVEEVGGFVYYPDNLASGDTSMTVSRCPVDGGEPEQLATRVRSYFLSDKGDKMIYLDADGQLFSTDFSAPTALASDVRDYFASDDASVIVYTTTAGALYRYENGAAFELSDNATLSGQSDDLQQVWYLSGDTLMVRTGTQDAKTIDTGVAEVLQVYPAAGAVYYDKQVNVSTPIADFLTDDVPNDASRDDLRAALAGEAFDWMDVTLCYYDGAAAHVLGEHYAGAEQYSDPDAAPVLVYDCYTLSDTPVGMLSDIETVEQAWEVFYQGFIRGYDAYLTEGAQSAPLTLDETMAKPQLDAACKTLYYMTDVDQTSGVGDLYAAPISGAAVGAPTLVAASVDSDYSLHDNGVVYFADVISLLGDLYVDGQHIDKFVFMENLKVTDDGHVLYYTDWDEKAGTGTLHDYHDGASALLSANVSTYERVDGATLYLVQGDDTSSLWVAADGHNLTKLADGVDKIVPLTRSDRHSFYW